MNNFKLFGIIVIGFVVIIGNINVSEAGGRGRKYVPDAAIIERPQSEFPPTPVLTHVPDKAVPEEMISIRGKNFFYQKDSDQFYYSNIKEVFFVKDGIETKAEELTSVSYRGKLEDKLTFEAPQESGLYSLKIILKEGDPVVWAKSLIAVVDTRSEEELVRQKAIEEAVKQRQQEEEEEQRVPAEQQAPRCNPNVPTYSQRGCIEEGSEEHKRSPYDGLPCPGEEVPSYSKIGCIP